MPAVVHSPAMQGGTAAQSLAGESSAGRHVALCGISTITKKVVFHLACQVLARARVGQVQTVFIDQHGLVFEPGGPSLFADVFPDAFAKLAGVGRKIQAFSIFAEFDAIYSACDVIPFTKSCQKARL